MQCDYFYPHQCPILAIHSLPTTPFPTTMPFSFAFKQWVLPGNLYHHLSGSPFIYKDSVLFLSLSPTHRQLSKVWEFKMFWVKFCCWFLLVHISAFIYKSLGVCVFVSCMCVYVCLHVYIFLFVIQSHIWHGVHVQALLFVLTFHLQMCASVPGFIRWQGIWTIVPNADTTSTSTCWSTSPVPDHYVFHEVVFCTS